MLWSCYVMYREVERSTRTTTVDNHTHEEGEGHEEDERTITKRLDMLCYNTF